MSTPSSAAWGPGSTARWPKDRLEHLGRCPVCASNERGEGYRGVQDGVFGTPGTWDYWRCTCGLLYLDPRPAAHTVSELYRHYYTHESAGPPLRWRERGFRGAVRRGYLNARYGYRFPKASLLGRLTWRFRQDAVRNLDYMIRHLPAPREGRCKVLDIGCGNGDFVAVARDLGFQAAGLDPDSRAVELARGSGLDIRHGIVPGSGLPAKSFDFLFMSHVLEHLPDPMAALRECFALLAPGGRLWLSLPNLQALGLERFGRHWRGLEPPRHFALFDAARLTELLEDTGFERVELLPPEDAAPVYFRQSQAIACGLDPYGEEALPQEEDARQAAADAVRRARADPLVAEALTMVAWRPS
ncbi:MAG TPA: class I SAM-dependent methyltransferase [Allosphingosinicella sp.]|jgi:SAM-dependent methyltransferase